ncbi:MAG: cytochrome c oxidase subunit II [Candidatus Marinimicrobia bacterium CG1_02_48_14]|nr:MAG: cytochrome c oxidase subunit II [Candidatus Marinimicrobia bacterium CG1_02_48_14]PIZ68712.1 MAG: cytochrome c oxidase subunit II [Candidatus Marinimicrobia bacterium CG_4_10_14_0_2_um_filter_48_9]
MDSTATLWMPPAQSTIAGEVDALFYFIFYVAMGFFFLVVLAALYFLIRYRRKGNEVGLTDGHDHNFKLELIWTIIPTILVFIVFIWGFRTYLKMNVAPKGAIEIKVTGQKWFWSFDYPNGAVTLSELVVPAGRPVKLLLSSRDVIHSFYVPDFRIKMDALPNRYTMLWFEAKNVGTYNLYCAEYCGTGHSTMLGKVKVLSVSDYEKWLANAGAEKDAEVPLPELGKKVYTGKACMTCHTIDGTPSVGPTFKNVFGHTVELSDGTTITIDENYIRESVLKPQAKVVKGFAPVMPTFQGLLSNREIDGIIAYIKTLSEQ